MTNKSKPYTVESLCEKVAGELGWSYRHWYYKSHDGTKQSNGLHWMEKIKDKWHPVSCGEFFMTAENLTHYLLSPQGRELMEKHARELGVEMVNIVLGEYVDFLKLDHIDRKSLASSHTGETNKDYLLAFAKLTGILTDDFEE